MEKYKLEKQQILTAFSWALTTVGEGPTSLHSEEADQRDGDWEEQDGGGVEGGHQDLPETCEGEFTLLLVYF